MSTAQAIDYPSIHANIQALCEEYPNDELRVAITTDSNGALVGYAIEIGVTMRQWGVKTIDSITGGLIDYAHGGFTGEDTGLRTRWIYHEQLARPAGDKPSSQAR